MAETTRRRFLSAGVVAGAGLLIARNRVSAQGLGGQFAQPGQPPCTDTRKATPEIKNLGAFKPNAPVRTLIAEGGIAGVLLNFSGTAIGLTCGIIKNARVDVWHADIRGDYDMKGFNHRGAQMTDEKGAFAFQTTPPGAVDLAAAIKQSGVAFVVVTNNLVEEQRQKLEHCGLTAFVDHHVTSEVTGVAKPHRGIFDAALQRAGVSADEAVMLGDSWEVDVLGAQAAGIRPVWFNRFGQPLPDDTVAQIHAFEPVADAMRVLRTGRRV
jgi:HAD superfamily hydrolase (TIGR01549 family)